MRAQERPGELSPGELRTTQERPGELRTAKERPGELRTAEEGTGEPRIAQEGSGELRTAQERPGELRTTQEDSGEPRTAQESPEQARRAQESLKQLRRAQGSPWQPKECARELRPAEETSVLLLVGRNGGSELRHSHTHGHCIKNLKTHFFSKKKGRPDLGSARAPDFGRAAFFFFSNGMVHNLCEKNNK